jgi:hypothetical protein
MATIRELKAAKNFRALLAIRSAASDENGFRECRFQCDRHAELGTEHPIADIAAFRVSLREERERNGWYEPKDFYTAEDVAEQRQEDFTDQF